MLDAFPSFKEHNRTFTETLLVSFENGLALVNADKVHFLTNKQVRLSAVQPDNIMYYVQDYGERNNTQRQSITKAKLTGTTLEKLWEQKVFGQYLNHWGDAFGGTLYHPGRRFHNLPNKLSRQIGGKFAACTTEHSRDETIELFDSETGTHRRTIKLLPIMAALPADHPIKAAIRNCEDPIHINDVQIIKTPQQARLFPQGHVGDMLISLRSIDALLLLDKDTADIKWFVISSPEQRLFRHQHSPRLTPHGTLLVFDNKGSDPEHGTSRIVEIDIETKQLLGVYEGNDQHFFQSEKRGKVQVLGDRIFVYSQDRIQDGIQVFELVCPTEHVSQACQPIAYFTGKTKKHMNDNAVVLLNP